MTHNLKFYNDFMTFGGIFEIGNRYLLDNINVNKNNINIKLFNIY